MSYNIEGSNYPEQITDEFLTCFVCQVPGFRQKPKILSCGHTFCQPCLENLQNGNIVTCPKCEQTTNVPKNGGIAKLPTNVFFDTQIDRLLRRHNKARGRDDTWYNIRDYKVTGNVGHNGF